MLFAIEKEFASLDGRLVERVAVTRMQSHYRPASWWLRIRSREDGIRNRRYGNFREAAPAASGRSDERRREPHHQRDQRRHDGAGRRRERRRTDHDDHYRWRESGYRELLTAAFMSTWARWLQVFSGKTQGREASLGAGGYRAVHSESWVCQPWDAAPLAAPQAIANVTADPSVASGAAREAEVRSR
jgi:hypothetical protein